MKDQSKNGISFKKDVPLKSKNKLSICRNDVRRRKSDYKIETSNILPSNTQINPPQRSRQK
jgi:hypothetical protein